jgi:hypothetical protein
MFVAPFDETTAEKHMAVLEKLSLAQKAPPPVQCDYYVKL